MSFARIQMSDKLQLIFISGDVYTEVNGIFYKFKILKISINSFH